MKVVYLLITALHSALDESAAVTLMSTDVQRICDSLAQLHEVWASIIEIALAIWLLSREIGVALLGPLALMVGSIFAMMAVSKRMGPAQKLWMEAIQSRINVTSKMLESMKGIKMLGLTPIMTTLVQNLRSNEITLSLKSRRLLATVITLANISHTIAPGAAFIIYVLTHMNSNQTLDVSQAFTALSLISLLSGPIATLIFSAPPLMASLGCVERIQSFLFSKTREDHRIVLNSAGRDHRGSNRQADMSNQDIELQTMLPRTASSNTSKPIRVLHATFAWKAEDLAVVKDVSFELDPGSLTFIVGPVSSGKSSLLKGILGEIPSSKGFVYVDAPQTAYVQQTPWIQHKTFRNNVLGTSLFDKKWYDTVIHACSLDVDIAELPKGDATLVGSSGLSLSGGQKLRLSLARAVYSGRKTLILDDTFSGLDAESEDAIFTRLLGRRGLLRQLGTTVLLVSHAAHRLSYADHIIALTSDGAVSEAGTFQELMSRGGYISSLSARHKTESGEDTNDKTKPLDAEDPKKSADTAVEEVVRSLGDIQVYKYYFGAVGWRNTAGFFVMIISFAFFSRFPGKYSICSNSFVWLLTIYRSVDEVLDFGSQQAW